MEPKQPAPRAGLGGFGLVGAGLMAFGGDDQGVGLDSSEEMGLPPLSPGAMSVCMRHLRRLVPFLDTSQVRQRRVSLSV